MGLYLPCHCGPFRSGMINSQRTSDHVNVVTRLANAEASSRSDHHTHPYLQVLLSPRIFFHMFADVWVSR